LLLGFSIKIHCPAGVLLDSITESDNNGNYIPNIDGAAAYGVNLDRRFGLVARAC